MYLARIHTFPQGLATVFEALQAHAESQEKVQTQKKKVFFQGSNSRIF
jgi:hypothetical protein